MGEVMKGYTLMVVVLPLMLIFFVLLAMLINVLFSGVEKTIGFIALFVLIGVFVILVFEQIWGGEEKSSYY